MSILKMTYMSYLFIIISIVFGVTAVIMYFVFDIKRCWRIVRGNDLSDKFYTDAAQTQKTEGTKTEKTERLIANKSTVLLTSEETVPLESMKLVQDIVMMG